MSEILKIALPNKGRLSQKIYELLNSAGLNLDSKDERCLKLDTKDKKFQLIFVRAADIPNFLDSKVADIGFTGRDIVVEKEIELDIVKEFSSDKEELINAIRKAGIVGMGGAGFPTPIKTTIPEDKKADILIINGIECEPYLSSDHRLMLEFPDRIMKGIGYALQAFGAKRAIICIKNKYQDIYDVLSAVKTRYPHLPIEIARIGNYYPQGWEINMIKNTLGIEIPSGVLPSKYGIMNFNVSTIVGLYKAIRYNMPVAKRFFTVTGDGINYAQNFRVRVGTSISELLELCDGYTPGKDKLFIMGGSSSLSTTSVTTSPVSWSTV